MSSTESSDLGAAPVSQTPQHHDQQINRENPNEDDLPESQIARAIMIGRNVWVAREKSLSIFEDIESGEDNKNETDAEKNSQRYHRVGVGMSYR